MWERIAKLSSFTLGASLMLLGTVQLYAGLSAAVSEEALIASTVSAFMVLFPGVVFLSYAMKSMEPSRLMRPSTQLLVNEDRTVYSSVGENIVEFPAVKIDPIQPKPAAQLHSK